MELKCDFCSYPDAPYSYEAEDFLMHVAEHEGKTLEEWSEGGWAACEPCHKMIEAGDREGLVDRSVEQFALRYPTIDLPEKILREAMRRAHDLFFTYRK